MPKKWSLIFCGGSEEGREIPGDPHGQTAATVNYRRHGCRDAVCGVVLALLAPLLLLPSSFGTVPIVYSSEFLELSKSSQYFELLWKNILVVLKAGLKLDLIREIALPKPPDSGLGDAIVIVIALLDIAAVFFLTAAVIKSYQNFRHWQKAHEE